MQLERESTEYIYVGVTGDEPTVDQELAFKLAGVRPDEIDWITAILVDSLHALFAKAQATGLAGDYYLALLIGSYNSNPTVLSPETYQVWLRLSGADERPVRIAPVTLEIL